MTAAQTEMVFKSPAAAPVVDSEEIGLLLNILRGAGWMNAAAIRNDSRFVAHYNSGPCPITQLGIRRPQDSRDRQPQ